VNPFFAVDEHPAGAVPAAPWRPFREVVDDPRVLTARITAIQAYLATGGGRPAVRVAASVTHLGLVARLISPTLGIAASTGDFPALDLADVWWQPEPGGTFPLSAHYRPGGCAAAFVDGPLRTLTERFDVSAKVLWGNVASAINGAATMLGTTRAAELAAELLDTPPLRGTGTRRANGGFQRRSCCLIYQAAAEPNRHAVCGDCVLAP
jgi:hypothetical protein